MIRFDTRATKPRLRALAVLSAVAVREFAGLLTAHRGKQAMFISAMLVAYALLTFIVYR